jgi:hypothetical protein
MKFDALNLFTLVKANTLNFVKITLSQINILSFSNS